MKKSMQRRRKVLLVGLGAIAGTLGGAGHAQKVNDFVFKGRNPLCGLSTGAVMSKRDLRKQRRRAPAAPYLGTDVQLTLGHTSRVGDVSPGSCVGKHARKGFRR